MAVNSRSGQDLKPYTLEHIANQSFDQEAQISMVESLTYDPTSGDLSRAFPANALNLKPFDYVARVLTNSTTETYTFKSGGASGTTTNTVVIVYTGTDLGTISTITKT